ncbi:MAG: hypothetical protein ACR2FI_03695 [Burkholderiales bacterium]
MTASTTTLALKSGQVKLRGQAKVSDVFTLSMLAVNLRRLPKLLAAQAMVGSG